MTQTLRKINHTSALNRKDVVAILKARLRDAGDSISELGRQLGGKKPVSRQYLNEVLKGRKRPGKRILEPLGLRMEKQEIYRRIQ